VKQIALLQFSNDITAMLIASCQKRCEYIPIRSGKNIPVFGGFANRQSASLLHASPLI
jgi:hypothetical protein